jgi:hypothetical protein
MLFDSGPREVPPQPTRSQRPPTSSSSSQQGGDATVPEAPAAQPPADTPEGSKKKPRPKPKGKPNGKQTQKGANGEANGGEQADEDSLRLTPTNYSKEGRAGEGGSSANLDLFNLSHDDFYAAAQGRNRVRHKTSKALVVHSTPACKLSLVPTHLTREDLQHFHHPRTSIPHGVPFRVTPVTKERHANGKSSKKTLNRVEMMKHKSDLSAREGRVIFTEYMEERPPLVENVGMATRISNFYRKKSPDDIPILSVCSCDK